MAQDSIAAVIAHGLLNSLTVVNGAVSTLGRVWDGLTPEQRVDMAETALSQAEVMADGLEALPDSARHRLANHLFIVRETCHTLKLEGDRLAVDDRAHLVGVVQRQSSQAANVLEKVVRALPDDIAVILNQLDTAREDRVGVSG